MHDHLGLDASAALPSLFLQLNFEKMLYVQFPEIYTIINARRQKFELHALMGLGFGYVIDPKLNNCKIAPTLISNI